MQNLIQEYSIYSLYFAPRGKERLLFLGDQIGRRHLQYTDKLIGILGDAGSGKSSLIKGMFPGLELTNDDDRLDAKKIMQVRDPDEEFNNATTFHLDMRFQIAFTQMHEIVAFVNRALERDRRVIVEHFNLLFPALKQPADLMVGIGAEILVVRPTVFGPFPQDVYEHVHTSLKYRKMAHTVEDITIQILREEYHVDRDLFFSSDIKNGFLLRFTQNVDLNFDELSERINNRLAENLHVHYLDENHIQIGDSVTPCSGPRLHLQNTSEVEGFSLVNGLVRDDKTNTWCLVGILSPAEECADILHNFHSSSALLSGSA